MSSSVNAQDTKACEPTQTRLRELLDYNGDTGVFTWRVSPGRRVRAGATAGSISHGYRQIAVDGKSYYAHRLVWLYVYGVFPNKEIDHINGDKTDNRIVNLRDVDRRLNTQNLRCAPSNSTHGFMGASWDKQRGKWRARIRLVGRTKYLGYFRSPESANEAYLAAKRLYHQGCTI